jgi:hypothetical protein
MLLTTVVHTGVVLHFRERFIKIVLQPTPPLILLRLPETHGMVFEVMPVHKKKISVRFLNALLQLMRNVARNTCNDALRLTKSRLKFTALTRIFDDYFPKCFSRYDSAKATPCSVNTT